MRRNLAFFIAAVVVQCGILAAVPGRQIYTRMTGKVITIQTRPVDPYDIMSGYYVTLSYDIGWYDPNAESPDMGGYRNVETVYVTVKKGPEGVWLMQSISSRWPADTPDDTVVIKGRCRSRARLEYGIERFYIPETKRQEIESALREAKGKAMVDVAVDASGNASILRLTAGEKTYEY